MFPARIRALKASIESLLDTVPPDVQYYGMGGTVEIPTPAECALLKLLETSPPQSRAELAPIARELDSWQAYLLTAFAIRMATLAVRNNAIDALRAGSYGLVLDNDLIDWRDTLVSLSVIEHSAFRLKASLSFVIQDAFNVASDRRRWTITEYCSRVPGLRRIELMGIKALGDGESFRYEATPWY